MVRGLGLGVLAVVDEVWVRAWERVIARRDRGGEDWEECKPFRQASRWPKEVASARGGISRDQIERVVRELGPEEEGLRGGGGEERDCGGGEQGLSVSPYQGADGPKVMG